MIRFLIHNILLLTLCGLAPNAVWAQLPSTDLYQVTFTLNEDKMIVRNVSFLNSFNKDGYNNQPKFSAFDKVLISSNRYDKTQTDVLELDLSAQTILRITDTDVPEYSPTPHPDGQSLSTVRVEADEVTQSLWIYPKDRSDYGYRVLSEFSDVGYHHWLSEEEVVLFRLPEPFNMTIANIETGVFRVVLDNIGRCFKSNENGKLLFVHKISPDQWWIKTLDPENDEIESITPTLTGAEDFELLKDGNLIMGKDSELYYFDTNATSASWTLLADLKEFGITNINRIAVSNNKMIIINSK